MKSICGKPVLSLILAVFFTICANAAVFAQSECTQGDRWSLAQARKSLAHASALAHQLGNADCSGSNYSHCQRIMAAVTEAQDNIYQVFNQNYDSGAACRRCGFGFVLETAAFLESWESWLLARNFRSAAGVGNIRFTINQYARVPLCSSGGTNAGLGGGIENGTDRPGGDYTSLDISSNPELCRRACEGDANCKAWTYVAPGVQGSSARCWLKNTVPAAVASNCCASGVVRRGSGPAAGTVSASVCPSRFSSTFSMTANTSIPGSNRVTGIYTTPQECAEKCLRSDWCVSFEVDHNALSCNYQDVHPCNAASNLKSTPGVDLYSRNGVN